MFVCLLLSCNQQLLRAKSLPEVKAPDHRLDISTLEGYITCTDSSSTLQGTWLSPTEGYMHRLSHPQSGCTWHSTALIHTRGPLNRLACLKKCDAWRNAMLEEMRFLAVTSSEQYHALPHHALPHHALPHIMHFLIFTRFLVSCASSHRVLPVARYVSPWSSFNCYISPICRLLESPEGFNVFLEYLKTEVSKQCGSVE